ncbi:MAG: DUF4157 domain-containing protein [Lacibacter sp.]|jgi:hypothetical protein
MAAVPNQKRVRIRENSWLARLAAFFLGSKSAVAMVWGRSIHVWGATREQFLQNPGWLRHELAHIEQVSRYGWVPFVLLYAWYSIRFGYYNNPFEVAARQKEKEPVEIGSYVFV